MNQNQHSGVQLPQRYHARTLELAQATRDTAFHRGFHSTSSVEVAGGAGGVRVVCGGPAAARPPRPGGHRRRRGPRTPNGATIPRT